MLHSKKAVKYDIAKLCTTLKQLKTELASIEKKRAALGDLTVQLHVLQDNEKQREHQRTTIKNSKELLLHTKGSIENQHKQLAKIKVEYEQEQAHIIALDATADDYQAIALQQAKMAFKHYLLKMQFQKLNKKQIICFHV